MPKVSIIVPAYNVAPWVEETLNSVKKQTFNDFECIIVDDKSTDNTAHIVRRICDSDIRFKLVKNKYNYGVSVSRNIGMNMAKGEYISFLDADDLWHPEFISTMLNIIQEKQVWIAYSRFILFNDGTNIKKTLIWDNLLRTKNRGCPS